MGKNTGSNVMSADSTLSLQTYLTRITRVRLRLQQVANASDPEARRRQTLAQTVFQGNSVDLTDTQQYGSLDLRQALAKSGVASVILCSCEAADSGLGNRASCRRRPV